MRVEYSRYQKQAPLGEVHYSYDKKLMLCKPISMRLPEHQKEDVFIFGVFNVVLRALQYAEKLSVLKFVTLYTKSHARQLNAFYRASDT